MDRVLGSETPELEGLTCGEPCKFTAACAVILSFCEEEKHECGQLIDDFLLGNKTLRELGNEVGASNEAMDFLAGEVDMDKLFPEVQDGDEGDSANQE